MVERVKTGIEGLDEMLEGGLPKGHGAVPVDTNAIHYGNFIVTGSTGGSVQDYRIALRLLAGKRVG